MRFALLLAAALLNSPACGGSVDPYVVPSSKPVPPQPPNACDLESEHLKALGGCGVWSESYAADCREVDRRKLEDHRKQRDHTCAISAPDCATEKACP